MRDFSRKSSFSELRTTQEQSTYLLPVWFLKVGFSAEDKKLFVFCAVRNFEKENFLETSRILSRFVQFKSVLFNLLCIFEYNKKLLHRRQATVK